MFLEYISNISLSSEEKEKLNLFVRSSVKKSIMTDPYGVTFLESYKYFLEASKQEDSLILKKMFQYFYGFVNKEMEKKMYIKSSISLRNDILKQTKSNKQLVIATFDSVTDLIYFKIKKKEIDLIIENKRKTTSYDETTSQIDYIKLRSASRANIIHLIDALYMRDLTRAFGDSFITIHDCAYIDHMSISKFIQCANFIMKAPVSENIFLKNQLNDDCEIYSIFILL
jgi:hypothetical protein